MPTEEEYYSWRTATFGNDYDIYHDGLNTQAVDSLEGEARSHALEMLYTGVEVKDACAAEALAAMKEIEAVPALRAQLAHSNDDEQVIITRAIQDLCPSDTNATKLIEVLENISLHWGTRLDAAQGLSEFSDEVSEEALRKAVAHDRNYLVRYHASDSLLKRWKVQPDNIASHREILKLISGPRDGVVGPEEEAGFAEALVRLEGLRSREV